MNTKICNICQIEKTVEEFNTQINRGRKYLVYCCIECDKKRLSDRNKRIKKNPVRMEYLNCAIRDNNKVYYTNSLSSTDIIDLKESGYSFIFK